MAQFSVKTRQALSQVEEERQMANELGEYEDCICSVANRLSFRSSALENIRARLRAAANQVGAESVEMNKMRSALSDILKDYEQTEQRIYSNAGGKGNLQRQNIADSTIDKFSEEEYIRDFVKNLIEAIQGTDEAEWIWNRIEDFEEYITKAIENTAGNPGLLLMIPELIKNGKETYDGIINKVKDGIVEATGFEAKVSKEDSWYSKQMKSEHGSLGVSALAYKAYASAEGGLFRKDDDGNLVFNPNIAAKAGASVTAFEAIGAYAVGNEWLGADASGHITAGKVSGEVEAQAALMDENGNFNPHAKLNASAEAILVDAKASAGVTVLGTRADVTGSVNVGVGAHANVEIGDGKIACDIGASLGIGASISFTIDYGETVKAVKSVAKSAVQNVFKSLWSW